MPRTKSIERENERRRQLLIATFAVFGQKGFDRSTLEDIAAKAGFSKAVVLYYFDSKEDLLVATFEWIIGDVLGSLATCGPGAEGALDMLRAQLEHLFVSTRSNRRFYHVYLEFLARSAHNHRYSTITGRFYAHFIAAVAHTIERGMAQGIFHPVAGAYETASMCGAIMDGLQMQWLFDDESLFESYRERCWRGWLMLLNAHE